MNCGLGIRPELFAPVAEALPSLGFLEAHSENYFGDIHAKKRLLELRHHYPVSLHGVGLSLGRADELDQAHLAQLKQLVDEVDPLFVSEHLSWSAYAHQHVPDLLPLPLTEQALQTMCEHVEQMQTALGRQILVENPSNYLAFDMLQMSEPEFLNLLAQRTGCGLLVDVNNVYVSAFNLGRDPLPFLEQLDSAYIAQYHLAGYTEVQRNFDIGPETLLIDTHDHCVYSPVWSLFEQTLTLHGARPTLFEWDSDFPELEILTAECEKANRLLDGFCGEQVDEAGTQRSTPIDVCSPAIESKTSFGMGLGLSEMQSQFLDDLLGLSSKHGLAMKQCRERISVYQNNVYGALQDYLAGVFTATQGVVGDAFFRQMMQQLIQSAPPTHGNIHLYGGELLGVLKSVEGLDQLPYLADLIRYEWGLHQCYYDECEPLFDPSSLPQESLLLLPLKLHGSVRMIMSDYPILEIHRQSLPSYSGEVAVNLNQKGDHILVHMAFGGVNTLRLSESVTELILAIQKVENLMQAIEALSGSIDPNELTSALGFLFDNRLLVPNRSGSLRKH